MEQTPHFPAVGAPYARITPEQAKQRMDAGGVTVLDVREPDEYAEGHIPGARLLPLGQVRARAADLLADRDAPVLVYCLSGARSQTACDILCRLGYTNVSDLGGMSRWPYDLA